MQYDFRQKDVLGKPDTGGQVTFTTYWNSFCQSIKLASTRHESAIPRIARVFVTFMDSRHINSKLSLTSVWLLGQI